MLAAIKVKTNWRDWVKGIAVLIVASQLFVSLPESIFKLILGELKPSEGNVVYKDKSGNEITPDLSKIGYIPQDPVVFPAIIKDNITMFNDQLDGKVKAVVKEVNFDADIAEFKDGLNEELDLDKLNILGGQRQKIVLARAKVHDSDIILIDECTSAIDQMLQWIS